MSWKKVRSSGLRFTGELLVEASGRDLRFVEAIMRRNVVAEWRIWLQDMIESTGQRCESLAKGERFGSFCEVDATDRVIGKYT